MNETALWWMVVICLLCSDIRFWVANAIRLWWRDSVLCNLVILVKIGNLDSGSPTFSSQFAAMTTKRNTLEFSSSYPCSFLIHLSSRIKFRSSPRLMSVPSTFAQTHSLLSVSFPFHLLGQCSYSLLQAAHIFLNCRQIRRPRLCQFLQCLSIRSQHIFQLRLSCFQLSQPLNRSSGSLMDSSQRLQSRD